MPPLGISYQDFEIGKREKNTQVLPNLNDINKVQILYYVCIQHNFYPDYNLVGKKLNIKV